MNLKKIGNSGILFGIFCALVLNILVLNTIVTIAQVSDSKPQKIVYANSNIDNSRFNAITKAVQECSPAIVGINVTEVHKVQYNTFDDLFGGDPLFQHFFGGQNNGPKRYREYEVRGLGSGFIVSPDGFILTNHHVAGNASKVIVTTTDGKKFDAEVIGADETSDVALLKIDAKNLPFLKLANSDNVVVGEWSIAFGNPFGLFDLNAKPTVTVGVVSNMGIGFSQERRVYKNMIQTDAAISSGNSGGPLVNSLGEVIGINTVIFSTAQSRQGAGSIGIGWAIPINRVKEVYNKLKNNEKLNRNFYTGLEIRELDEQLIRYLKSDIKEGLAVTTIYQDSPAFTAGFEPGDIILEIDGKKIIRPDDFFLTIYDGVVGQKFKFVVLRGKEKVETTLQLKERKN